MKFFLSLIFLFNLSVSEAKECKYFWNIESMNFHIGTSEDLIIEKNDQISIKSNFKPSSFLKTFGANDIYREINYDSNFNMTERIEIHEPNKQYILNNYQNTYFSPLDQSISLEKKYQITIDSTSFPYLLKLNQLNTNTYLNVVNKHKIIYSKIQKKDNSYYIEANNWKIETIVSENNEPHTIIATNNSQKATSKLNKKICENP